MNRIHRSRTILGGAGLSLPLLVAGCAWDRFEELRIDPPVEELNTPRDREQAFGQALTTVRLDETAMVMVSGTSHGAPASVFSLGTRERPTLDVFDKSHCVRTPAAKVCSLVEQPVALARAWSPSRARDFCFISGVGRSGNGDGLWARCNDRTEYAYPLPSDLEDTFIRPLLNGSRPPSVRLAVDRSESPLVVAGAPGQARAWYYEPLSGEPIDLVPNGAPAEEFGKSVAVVRGAGSSLVAVGSSQVGGLWLFRVTGAEVAPLGCLTASPGLGRTLAPGDVDGDGLEDLIVADDEAVQVFSGAALGALVETTDEGCNPDLLPAEARLTRFVCAQNEETSGCRASGFGAAVAAADLDGDGRAEIAVGAPHMTVRDLPQAGAVLIYDGGGKLVDTRVLSTAQKEAYFGASVAAVSQGEPGQRGARDILVVGAPGNQKASILYCTSLVGSAVSARCE